jgi:hypothetical protein
LTDVRVRQQAGPDSLAQTISVTTWPDNFLTIERPAEALLTEPIVIAHGTVHHNPPPLFQPQAGFGVRVFENSPNDPVQFGDVGCFPQSRRIARRGCVVDRVRQAHVPDALAGNAVARELPGRRRVRERRAAQSV